jgi:predicted nucleic acid-binding protein
LTTLIDTSVLISHLRGHEQATQLLLDLRRSDRLMSVMTRVEIEGGMSSHERNAVSQLMSALTVVPVSDAIAQRAGELLAKYRRSHPGIDLVDYVIAATAELYGAKLATLNVRHFPNFKGLKPAFK